MASEGKLLFDLNELPTEDDDDGGGGVNQPQKAIPSANPNTSGLLATPSPKIKLTAAECSCLHQRRLAFSLLSDPWLLNIQM